MISAHAATLEALKKLARLAVANEYDRLYRGDPWQEFVAALESTSPAPSAAKPVAWPLPDPRFVRLVKAAIDLIAAVDENLDTKDVPLKYTVPWGAVTNLRNCIDGTAPPAPQATAEPACPTCNENGLVGGFVDATNGYDAQDCPDCAPASTTAETMEPVEGDVLPPIGAEVLIHLARQDEWVKHTVAGYYVWPGHGDPTKWRVNVRVRDSAGYLNARSLQDLRHLDGSPWIAAPASAPVAEAEEVKDAARYRWLREQENDDFTFAVVKNPHFDVYGPREELDAAIDAALTKKEQP